MSVGKASQMGIVFGIVCTAILSSVAAHSASAIELSEGQTVYVPVYSHIYIGSQKRPFDLAISLSIRNTDVAEPITVLSVGYFDSNGKLVREYLKESIQVAPFASADFFVSEQDTAGGFGAAFLVKWKSATKVNEPFIEGVMVGTKLNQGISFTSRGKAIKDRAD